MTVAGLIVLRQKQPDAPRPYRMFGYPATAILFVVMAGWMVVSAVISSPRTSAIGTLILASGVPAYYLWRRNHA